MQELYQTIHIHFLTHSKLRKHILFLIDCFLPDLTVMSSLSRSWSVWWDNLYGSDCWVSWGFMRSYKWASHPAPWVTVWNSSHEYLFPPDRHASPQNQERPGCSGEAEGVWRHPPTLWQGDWSQTCGTTLCVALMASSMMLTIFPYMPCLSKDSDIKIKSETCHCTVSWMCCLFLFSDMGFSSTEEAHGCSSCSEDCASEAHSQGNI